MEIRYLPTQDTYGTMTTQRLRNSFVFERLFVEGEVTMVYCDADRSIVGGAIPGRKSLALRASRKEMATDHFTERREIGVLNIGGKGAVRVDDKVFVLAAGEILYVGRGRKAIEFSSEEPKNLAVFYFVSYPAHSEYPTALVKRNDSEPSTLGSTVGASKRTIYKYIHPGGARSCQLVMGVTELESGSVWNTMPPHTHQRRSEIYMYYDLDPDDVVIHLMGEPHETRSLIVRNRQAVISPSWSIHCGAATKRYSFVWTMGGENQEFSDMDPVTTSSLR